MSIHYLLKYVCNRLDVDASVQERSALGYDLLSVATSANDLAEITEPSVSSDVSDWPIIKVGETGYHTTIEFNPERHTGTVMEGVEDTTPQFLSFNMGNRSYRAEAHLYQTLHKRRTTHSYYGEDEDYAPQDSQLHAQQQQPQPLHTGIKLVRAQVTY